jgi:hypothetical protein
MFGKKEKPVQTVKRTTILYINHAKKYLPKSRKHLLALAKEELRILFGK